MSMEGNADCDSVQMTTHADKYLLAWEQEHRIAAERWRNQARAGENSFHFPMVSPLRKEVRSTRPRSCGEDAALAESDERPQQLTSPLLPRSLSSELAALGTVPSETAMRAWKTDKDAEAVLNAAKAVPKVSSPVLAELENAKAGTIAA